MQPPSGTNPDCKCNRPSNKFQVKKDNANHGRWFYTCSNCNFFQWADGQPNQLGSPGASRGQARETPQSPRATPSSLNGYGAWQQGATPLQGQRSPQGLPSPHGQQAAQGTRPMPPSFTGHAQGGTVQDLTQGPQSPHEQHGQASQGTRPLPQSFAAYGFGGGPSSGGGDTQLGTPLMGGSTWPGRTAGGTAGGGTPIAGYGYQTYQGAQHGTPNLAQQQWQQQQQHGMPGTGGAAAAAAAGQQLSPSGTAGVKVKLQVLPKGSFGATFAFNEHVVDLIRGMPRNTTGRVWDPEGRMWRFHMAAYDDVVAELTAAGCVVEPLEKRVVDIINGKLEGMTEEEAEQLMQRHLPQETLDNLFEFQREGVKFIVRCKGRALLADEPGLGKTVQAVCAAACFPEAFPLLVVCPSSMRFVWSAALLDWLPDALLPAPGHTWVISSSKDIKSAEQRGFPTSKAHVCITSYDLAQKLDPGWLKRYGFIIVDESHSLKNREAKRTQIMSSLQFQSQLVALTVAMRTSFMSTLVKQVRHAVLLTGTPLLSKPIEVFSQVDMLRPGLLGSYREYGNRYEEDPLFDPAED